MIICRQFADYIYQENDVDKKRALLLEVEGKSKSSWANRKRVAQFQVH